MIPSWIKIHIKEENKKGLRLFIPFILIWLLLLVLLILLSPFLLIASLILWAKGHGKKILSAVPLLFSLICSLSGLIVQVEEEDKKVFVSIR